MYKNIISAIKEVKTNQENSDVGQSERDKYYFIEGLNVAVQIVNEVRENDIEDAYETFEDTVNALKKNLFRHDMEVIIEDIFMDEDEDI